MCSSSWRRAIVVAVALGGCGSDPAGGDVDAGGGAGDGGGGDAGVDGPAAPCTPAALQDAFTAASLDDATWRTVGVSGWTIAIADGRLAFTPNPAHANTRTGLVTSIPAMDLTACATWLEVPRVLPAAHPGEVNVALSTSTGGSLGLMRARQGSLQLVVYEGSAFEEAFTPYDATAHRWWRFRDAGGGELALETSPDAQTWTTQLQRPHGADLAAVKLSLSVIETSLSAAFDAPQFDNVNVVP